jgi:DNA-binding CsgD family transcriptional regulator
LADDKVLRMIGRVFNVPSSQKSLPDVLNAWINHERTRFRDDSEIPVPSVPLVVNNGSHRLIVRFLWGGQTAEQDMLLMEEKPLDSARTASDNPNLTRRETEILSWLSQGKTNVEIGLALSISPRTVKKHLEHIYGKLKVHRRSAAVARNYHS